MTADAAPRVGAIRADRPLAVVAEIDARVIRHELERRAGPVSLDLRIDGTPIGRWASSDHLQGPSDVDALLDPAMLWNTSGPRLAHLFARTVAPEAAGARLAMLRHLGVVPNDPFVLDDICLARLDPTRVRPTDLWLVATTADDITVSDVDVRALGQAAAAGATDMLDTEFDRVAEALGDLPTSRRHIARLRSERDELRDLVAELEARARRDEADMNDRLAAVERDLAMWRERAERAELDIEMTPDER